MSKVPSPTVRTEPEGKIASQYALKEYRQRAPGNQVEETTKLFGRMKKKQTTSAAASMVLGYRAHRFLQEGKVTDLLPIVGCIRTQGKYIISDHYTGTDNGADREQVSLPIFETGGALEVNTYYRSRDLTWLGLACGFSFSIPEKSPTLLTFRIALNVERHDAKRRDLDKTNELRVLKGILECLIVFAPLG